jgi:integrase/recombinase XerD
MKHLTLKNTNYQYWYTEFGDFIKTIGYGNGKNTMYATNVREFLHFLENKHIHSFNDVVPTTINEYHQYICLRPNTKKEGLLSPSTISQQMLALRLFFDYLLDCKVIEYSPARIPKFRIAGFTPRQIVSINEIKQIFKKAKTLQEKAILSCAYGCGLRRNEIHHLNTGDINLKQQTLLVRVAKGGKSRTIPLSNKMSSHLSKYLKYHRNHFALNDKETSALFIGKNGNRMTGDLLNRRVKRIICKTDNKELQNKNITLHCLRHSIAVHLMDNGASIEFVQSYLGHSDIDTTHLYAIRRKRKSSILSAFR